MADYVSLTAQRRLRIPVPGQAEQLRLDVARLGVRRTGENDRRRVEILGEMPPAAGGLQTATLILTSSSLGPPP